MIFLFGIGVEEKTTLITFEIGGVDTGLIIDSGATVNVLDQRCWEQLKKEKIKVVDQNRKPKKKLFAYGNETPLTVVGSFVANIKVKESRVETTAEFFVIKEKGKALLGRKTAMELKVVRLGPECEAEQINSVDIRNLYPNCFEGLGKLKRFPVKTSNKQRCDTSRPSES
ncbi:uncharacterized protein LOC117317001 [Pecten maximus]|uniref:uncharacterized protein LOC117317001 n=1 Tax=Pecten maximus TaxID=6579 RepID=UPI001457F670|nr:uncharacterized protein LOC117317001 [Pecten maximus]